MHGHLILRCTDLEARAMRHCAVAVLVAAISLYGCATVPPAIDAYVQMLPKRSGPNGAYSPLLPELKAQLALEDAAVACSVDLTRGLEREKSPACQCTNSSLPDWAKNCDAWLGSNAAMKAGK